MTHWNLLTLRSGPGTQIRVQIRTSRKIWDRHVTVWGLGAYTLRDKRSMVKLFFFDFQGGEICLTRRLTMPKYCLNEWVESDLVGERDRVSIPVGAARRERFEVRILLTSISAL